MLPWIPLPVIKAERYIQRKKHDKYAAGKPMPFIGEENRRIGSPIAHPRATLEGLDILCHVPDVFDGAAPSISKVSKMSWIFKRMVCPPSCPFLWRKLPRSSNGSRSSILL